MLLDFRYSSIFRMNNGFLRQKNPPKTEIQNHSSDDSLVKLKKRVAFSRAIYVCLIPTLSEYRLADLTAVLWWEEEDYKIFKTEALEEINKYLQLNPSFDDKKVKVKNALSALYQPDTEESESSNLSFK